MTPEADRWHRDLDTRTQDRVTSVLDALHTHGPGLARPQADTIRGSRHRNMKELRSGTVRILFAFDSERRGIVLVGGDKRGSWRGWYKQNIKQADRMYDDHLRNTGRTVPWTRRETGRTSVEKDR